MLNLGAELSRLLQRFGEIVVRSANLALMDGLLPSAPAGRMFGRQPRSEEARRENGRAHMSVAQILKGKGRDVVVTQPHRTLMEAAQLLAEKGIGAVVVSDASRSGLGILSERDIIRAIARNGAGALEQAVSKYMTQKVFTVTEDTHVDIVMETMTNGRFRHVPVTADGQLIGLVSIGDVVKHHVNEIENEHQALRDYIATA
jgi:CBS domain-containing protein